MSKSRVLKLRRRDTCVACGTGLNAGTDAFWDAERKTVKCLDCRDTAASADGAAKPQPPVFDRGTPGASSRRRNERLRLRRKVQARNRYGRLSGIYLALTDDPQSTVAWAQGSRGERLLGNYLETLHDDRSVIVLHDRRVPGTRANIDHIAITRGGRVWVIDAKKYTGKVRKVDKGGWLSTDYRLYVGRRDCTKLVDGMAKQVDAIRAALGEPLIEEFEVEVRPALCFVDAEWPLFAKPFTLGDVWIGWPKVLGERLRARGELAPEDLMALARRVAGALPSA
jgi:hypothetical protein